MICEAKYEDLPDDETHTCLLDKGHRGRHRCPTCQSDWKSPRSGSENRLRNHQVNVRLSGPEYDSLIIRATSQGLTSAQLLRADHARIKILLELLDRWDGYTKGPSPTTQAIRDILSQEIP